MSEALPAFLRYRVIKRFDAGNTEVTSELPHLNQSSWKEVALQPGTPAFAAAGSFRISLYPPGTEQYAAAWPTIYSKLARWQRVEAYVGYTPRGIGLGKLKFAGFITGIARHRERPEFTLTGVTDLGLLAKMKPFPGELLSNDTTDAVLRSFMGTNELGASDTFNPYTAGNYTSSNIPAHTAGAWSGTTDDGLAVVTSTTGSGAALISSTGAGAQDRWHSQYVKCVGRLVPSADTANAGTFGIGISQSSANCSNSIVAWVTAYKTAGGRYNLNATLAVYKAGVLNGSVTFPDVLSNVEDPQGKIPLWIGFLNTLGGQSTSGANACITVNGKPVIQQYPTAFDPGTGTWYPFLLFGTPATGSAQAFLTNLVQVTRFTVDGASTAAAFATGTLVASTNSLPFGVDAGPTFLDLWNRLQTRDGRFIRYTPQPYVVGSRILGTVDYAVDPAVDRSSQVIYSVRNGNLIDFSLDDNAEPLSAGTEAAGLSTLDGGGLSQWHDIATAQSIGMIEDETLVPFPSDYNSQQNAARQVMNIKASVDSAGNKTAKVLRAADTTDVCSLLDQVTVDDPEQGINMLKVRIMAREFTEGAESETLTLDHFSWSGAELAH